MATKTKKKKKRPALAGMLQIRLNDADWQRVCDLQADYKAKHGGTPTITQVMQDALSLAGSFISKPELPSADAPIRDLFSETEKGANEAAD